MYKYKKFWIVFGTILSCFIFSTYPPTTAYNQVMVNRDSIAARQIRELKQEIKISKDSVRSGIKEINPLLPKEDKKVKIVYKTKIKRVEVPVIVKDTVVVYIPVDKSEYYLKSKEWSDSLAQQKHIQDSIEAYRKYELKHRSIFKKIFGSKVK
jgi:hypothetical protein